MRIALTFLLLWYVNLLKEVKYISNYVDRKADALINENIPAAEVLVIDTEGKSLGQMPLEEACTLARNQDLDLVCVAPQAKVPVCRFMDYSKYRYDLQKKSRDAKKNQKVVVVKEMRVSPVIGTNDFEVKLKNGREFLADGHKLKINLYYPKGKRRLLKLDSSSTILDKFVEALAECATVESTTKVDGKVMSVLLVPKKQK